MNKYLNKYRVESNRLQGWDYASNAMYFITLVTQNRVCSLGKIDNGTMVFSDFGKIIEQEWIKSFEIRNELFLDEYIIMPNHLHAIIILDNQNKITNDLNNNVENNDSIIETHGLNVETHGRASLSAPNNKSNAEFNRKPKSISSFVGGFKSAINSKIDDFIDENQLLLPKYNRNNHFFQSNYHDHIIRNNEEYLRIKNYIINNPKNWKGDSLNT